MAWAETTDDIIQILSSFCRARQCVSECENCCGELHMTLNAECNFQQRKCCRQTLNSTFVFGACMYNEATLTESSRQQTPKLQDVTDDDCSRVFNRKTHCRSTIARCLLWSYFKITSWCGLFDLEPSEVSRGPVTWSRRRAKETRQAAATRCTDWRRLRRYEVLRVPCLAHSSVCCTL